MFSCSSLKQSFSKPKVVYFVFLGFVLLASVYPIYMGIVMLASYLQNGGINATDYPKYIIPYTPICIALIVSVAFLPLTYKLCKRFSLVIVSIIAILMFLGTELAFENIVVFSETTIEVTAETVETWQWYMCIAPQITEGTMTAISKNPLITEYSPAYKIHFYMISIIIMMSVLGVVYGFYKMVSATNYEKKKPLIAQLISVLTFIGLCVLACFTAFFRTGAIVISPISAVLMTVFFLVFGITAGVYGGTWLYGQRKLLAVTVPAIIAMTTTTAMYIGEMVMMNWNLYRFGNGLLFDPIGVCPLAPVDFLVIAASGVITYFTLDLMRQKTPHVEIS